MKSNSFLRYVSQKNKLTFRNMRTGEEHWHLFISRAGMAFGVLGLLVVMFAGVLVIVAYTPVLDLVPGYPGARSRELLLSNIGRLDSLERQVKSWDTFNDNITLILDGKLPQGMVLDTARLTTGGKGSIAERIEADSLFRLQMRSDSAALMQLQGRKRREMSFEMLPPAAGLIVSRFDPRLESFGIELTPPPNQSVVSVLDGTVVLSEWSPQYGYTIGVQHAANMMSLYKGAARSLSNVGQRVKAGQAIAMIGEVTSGQIPHLKFELWYNGTPVDPENYIAF